MAAISPEKQALLALFDTVSAVIIKAREGVLTLPDKEQPTDPGKPPLEKGVINSNWSPDPDVTLWKVVPMTKAPNIGKFKIVDKNNQNAIAEFTTEDAAKAVLADIQLTYVSPTEPTESIGQFDAQGVRMIYKPKSGGQVVIATETYQKESTHSGKTRTSLYSNIQYKAPSGELTEYSIMDLSDNSEQNAPKLYSGGHTGSGESNETKQGRCYAVGYNQNGTLHLAKEYPYHPITPKFYNKIQYLDPNWKSLGDVRNKLVGMKVIYFPLTRADGKKVAHLEWWFDKKCLETGNVENDWVQMAFAEDDGTWDGPPYFENNGVLFNGKILGFYIRIDTPKKPVQFQRQGCHELELPAVKF